MDWPALYTGLKHAHITLVLLSGGLFALRGLAVLRGASWGMARAVRLASYGIDTLLLLAGASLWWLLGLHPVQAPWLGSKLLLLALYIVLGSLALKRARTTMLRVVCFVAALACFAFMLSVARLHHPWGVFSL